jgi:hypothetical protein
MHLGNRLHLRLAPGLTPDILADRTLVAGRFLHRGLVLVGRDLGGGPTIATRPLLALLLTVFDRCGLSLVVTLLVPAAITTVVPGITAAVVLTGIIPPAPVALAAAAAGLPLLLTVFAAGLPILRRLALILVLILVLLVLLVLCHGILLAAPATTAPATARAPAGRLALAVIPRRIPPAVSSGITALAILLIGPDVLLVVPATPAASTAPAVVPSGIAAAVSAGITAGIPSAAGVPLVFFLVVLPAPAPTTTTAAAAAVAAATELVSVFFAAMVLARATSAAALLADQHAGGASAQHAQESALGFFENLDLDLVAAGAHLQQGFAHGGVDGLALDFDLVGH